MTTQTRTEAGELSTRPPIFVAPGESLRGVAHRLWLESVGALVVGDARHPLGVISERDIVTQLARGADPYTTTAQAAMSPHVVSAGPHDPLFDIALRMVDAGVRHMPVVDEDGVVTGVVSIRDLVRLLLLDAFGG
jgi:CBS domain-containing protein